ncbi:hypothetical protein AMATHDRAFT_49490 [Amanita thiersii Skay4041]|uniref:Uncharacterized protein n=1 Tax=Amanita thiersii Skay4041 TaxID=703135 RepID=A0A2A9NJK7_9AGAR|nr:hypothetical protein AMATHDRAFT_49490 [Amanita thiersii Skay4041]
MSLIVVELDGFFVAQYPNTLRAFASFVLQCAENDVLPTAEQTVKQKFNPNPKEDEQASKFTGDPVLCKLENPPQAKHAQRRLGDTRESEQSISLALTGTDIKSLADSLEYLPPDNDSCFSDDGSEYVPSCLGELPLEVASGDFLTTYATAFDEVYRDGYITNSGRKIRKPTDYVEQERMKRDASSQKVGVCNS